MISILSIIFSIDDNSKRDHKGRPGSIPVKLAFVDAFEQSLNPGLVPVHILSEGPGFDEDGNMCSVFEPTGETTYVYPPSLLQDGKRISRDTVSQITPKKQIRIFPAFQKAGTLSIVA
jgi:hypothetical protein